MTRDWAGLTKIEAVSGVAQHCKDEGPDEFVGFVTLRAVASDGSFMSGQLDPQEVRQMALGFLEAAEAAETDAIVMRMLIRDVGSTDEIAATFVSEMRKYRAEDLRGDDA